MHRIASLQRRDRRKNLQLLSNQELRNLAQHVVPQVVFLPEDYSRYYFVLAIDAIDARNVFDWGYRPPEVFLSCAAPCDRLQMSVCIKHIEKKMCVRK